MTFDVGQTLAELDLDFLARRLGERGATVQPAALSAAAPAAWQRYEQLVEAGGGHPWQSLMETLLTGAGVRDAAPLVDWLWSEQTKQNLWRKPIPAMVALARELAARGVSVGIVSNSEGKLAELLHEIGIADIFGAIIDSGRIGIEKPDPRIFAAALDALNVSRDTPAIHIGDLYKADIVGALSAGWRAIWYGPDAAPVDDQRVAIAHDAAAARAALVSWGAL
ncbi:MAG TPA: HAD family hydrolase [Kofleriaceae bacterium]